MYFAVISLVLLKIWTVNSDTQTTAEHSHSDTDSGNGMFVNWSEEWLEDVDTNQRNYGMAVTDVDNDGKFDIIVAGFMGPNLVLKYREDLDRLENIAVKNSPYESLQDSKGQAIGVAACDIDGDGREEIYFINTNDAYAGISSYSDKLFKWRNGKYVDLFSDPVNANITSRHFAGRSVACLDRYGTGRYGFMIATYGHKGSGKFSLIEMDDYHQENDVETGNVVLQNNAKDAGIDKSTGGRGIVVGPILNSEGRSDIFFVNEGNNYLKNRGDNFLFKNLGNGSYVDVAKQLGITDETEAGRGVVLGDFNQDGLFDIVYGNYEGPHRLYLQSQKSGQQHFENFASPEMETESMIRTVVVADFDNDGHPEVLFNNINDHTNPQPNTLFKITSYGPDQTPAISKIDIGDALEEDGYGTGSVFLDLNKDGLLELLISHGEDVAQPIEIYRTFKGRGNNYLRIYVITKYGAPARGASIQILTRNGKKLFQVIDGGSGYLCQMEPMAHFGLGSDRAVKIIIKWPDSRQFVWIPKAEDIDSTLAFYHPDFESYQQALKASNMTTVIKANESDTHSHIEL